MTTISPYIETPTIPEGMTIQEYRINRPIKRVDSPAMSNWKD